MDIEKRQQELFDKLRQADPSIIMDGVSDEKQYISAPYRIMYVLKEVNGGSGWSLCDHLQSGGRDREHDPTWDNIARWTEGIFNLPKELPWSELEKDCWTRRERILPKICAINVKKTSGSYVSDENKIYTAARSNADILLQQLTLYDPEIVICCGTEDAFVDACFSGKQIEWKMTTRGIWYFRDEDKIVISFSHPAARVKYCYLYYALLDAVKEILNIKENFNDERRVVQTTV